MELWITKGDIIVSADNKSYQNIKWADLYEFSEEHTKHVISVLRDGQLVELLVFPYQNS